MHNSRIRQACSSGTCLDGLADRVLSQLLAYHLGSLHTCWRALSCLPRAAGSELKVEGTRGRSERSGEARLSSHLWPGWKGNSSE